MPASDIDAKSDSSQSDIDSSDSFFSDSDDSSGGNSDYSSDYSSGGSSDSSEDSVYGDDSSSSIGYDSSDESSSDDEPYVLPSPGPTTEDITWTDLVNATDDGGGDLMRTGAAGRGKATLEFSGDFSCQNEVTGDADEATLQWMGLYTAATLPTYYSYGQCSISRNGTIFDVYVGGTRVHRSYSAVSTGAILKMTRTGDDVEFYLDGTLKYTAVGLISSGTTAKISGYPGQNSKKISNGQVTY